MADPRGFLKVRDRELPPNRPVEVRLRDWSDVHAHLQEGQPYLKEQAGRCMDCGIPFCHNGCPLGNLIPEWNDLVWRGQWSDAIDRLHATNNFPEFTGRICPAPCESSCVLGINQPAVTIKNVEVSIIDEAFAQGLVTPQVPQRLTGHTVAVVGSGPAGLAAAQQLTRAGHTVAVYERDDAIGGPAALRRAGLQAREGPHRPAPRADGGGGHAIPPGRRGRSRRDLAAAAGPLRRDRHRDRRDGAARAVRARQGAHRRPRRDGVPAPGQRRRGRESPSTDPISAAGKHVIIIGGGDTGSDCLGTALRQGAASVTTLAIGKRPPEERPAQQPWPTDPILFEVSSSHAEGGDRDYLASTVEFLGDDSGAVTRLKLATTEYLSDGRRVPKSGTEREIPADLVLVAMGFSGPETGSLTDQIGIELTARGLVTRSDDFATSVPGVFVAGDAGRGQSLIVWAIAEGRAAAAAVDTYLSGSTELPSPVTASTMALRP